MSDLIPKLVNCIEGSIDIASQRLGTGLGINEDTLKLDTSSPKPLRLEERTQQSEIQFTDKLRPGLSWAKL